MKTKEPINLRAFEVKFLWPTNTKGARIKIVDLRAKDFGINNSKTLNYSYIDGDIKKQAIKYLESKGINVLYVAGHLLLSDTFGVDLF